MIKSILTIIGGTALVACAAVGTAPALHAEMGKAASMEAVPTADGEALVRQLWIDFKSRDKALFNHWLSDAFQSVHEDHARDKADEIKLLMGLHLGKYTLDNFKSTQDGKTCVVTYSVSVHEMIDGKYLPKAPAERLSVFTYNKGNWKWIAHANLNPMKK